MQDSLSVALAAGGALAAALAGVYLGRAGARGVLGSRVQAERERQAVLRGAELDARERALAQRAAAAESRKADEVALDAREAALSAQAIRASAQQSSTEDLRQRLVQREERVIEREQQVRGQALAVARARAEVRVALERAAGRAARDVEAALRDAELEEARSRAAQLVRQASDLPASAELGRRAKRLMGIAVGRFQGHDMTERHSSFIPLTRDRPFAEEELTAIAAVANVRLSLAEGGIRIDGLDGVGREIARRALGRLLKRPPSDEKAAAALARDVAAVLDREIVDLGHRAFAALEVEIAHPDLVKLVGRLNYRTSYTQNQWKHAIETAFLCGMMADELGLDRRTARRAALMHDIGKALTHELDGSHAVIGADLARRLGESEVVANAIGAHHTDEPCGTAYAYLVAAADAMSGARPGARRQTEENHMAKIAELERLSRGFRGVAEAFAVQGGREVRVYVHEESVDDLGAVRMSEEIAQTISREMTFPGQIKVTVIRELKAVEVAT